MALLYDGLEFDAIIYDLDNTLVYVPDAYIEKVVNETAQELGHELPPEFARKFWHRGDRTDLLIAAGLNPDEFWPVFDKLDVPEVRASHTRIYDDVMDTITGVGRYVPQGIVTGSPSDKAYASTELLGRHHFGSIISANPTDGVPGKPSPVGIQMCMNALGVRPERTMYVGNDDVDMKAARNAGVVGVNIDRGEWPLNGQAEIRITSLRELIQ